MRGSEEGRICVKRFRKTSPSPKPPDATGVRNRPTGVPSAKILGCRALSPSLLFPWHPRPWQGSSPNLQPSLLVRVHMYTPTSWKDSFPPPPSIWGHSCFPLPQQKVIVEKPVAVPTDLLCVRNFTDKAGPAGLRAWDRDCQNNEQAPSLTVPPAPCGVH